MAKLAVVLTLFNEASRIGACLDNISKWADDILIFDKGSTDNTLEIARRFPVTIYNIPFSPPGYEVFHFKNILPTVSAEWCVWSTPSEVFTPRLIEYLRFIIANDDGFLDAVFAFSRIYAFGQTDPATPYGNYPHLRMWHRDRALFTDKIHSGVQSRGNSRFIQDPEAYVLHQSHATFEGFVERQKGYAMCEADSAQCKEARALEFIRMGDKYDAHFAANPGADLRHYLGWKVSMYLAALACLHKHREDETQQGYQERILAVKAMWPERDQVSRVPSGGS